MNLKEIQSGQTMKSYEEQIQTIQATDKWEKKKEILSGTKTGRKQFFLMYLLKQQETNNDGLEYHVLEKFAKDNLQMESVEFEMFVSRLKTIGENLKHYYPL